MFLLNKVKYKEILDIDNLHVPKLKTTFIVGSSGSGKSTLLKLFNKLISPDSGNIYYENKLLSEISSINLRRKVVMLGQSAIIFDGTVKDNLLIGLNFSEKEFPTDNILKDMLSLVHLNKGLNENSHNLSGGEKQRLALARVLLLNPQVLLLDEPSSALDEDTEMSMLNSVLNYTKDNNITPIIITHSNKIKEKFSENIIEIRSGKVVLEGGV